MAIWPTPFLILAWLIALRRGSGRAAFAAGALLAIQATMGPYQGSYDVVILATLTIGTYWGFWRDRSKRAAMAWRLVRITALAAVACVIFYSPNLVGMLGEIRAGTLAPTQTPLSASRNFSPDLLGYFIPSPQHPYLKAIAAPFNQPIGAFDPVRVVFPGYLALLLGLAAVARGLLRRGTHYITRPWILSLFVIFLLSLGPVLHVNGKITFKVSDLDLAVPLPFILFWHVPLIGHGRVPANAVFTVALCLAVLSGSTVATLLRRVRFRALAWLLAMPLAAGVLFEGLATPVTIANIPISPFYRQIAAEPGAFAVMEMPVGWRDGRHSFGELHTVYLYYATIHQKPIVNGYVARAPDQNFKYYAAKPALSYLIDPSKPPSPEAQNREMVRQTLRELNVRYVLLHPHHNQKKLAEYLERTVGLPQVYVDGQLWAYRLD